MWLDLARVTFEELDDSRGIGQVLHNGGTLAAQQGDFDRALDLYQDSLEIRRRLFRRRAPEAEDIGKKVNGLDNSAKYGRNV
jgi:hypothetical protein